MTFKTTVRNGALALAMMLSAASSLHAGIIDLVTTAFSKPVSAGMPTLRILLAHDKHGVIIETKGKYKIYDPSTGERVGMSFSGKRRYMQPLPDGLRWGESFPGVYQLVIVPDDPATTTLVDGVEYQGNIYIYDIGGSVSVVNSLPVEDYLLTLLPQRYTDTMPEEMLAALAITERTNYYCQSINGKTAFWDIDAVKEGYQGSALIRPSTAMGAAVRKTCHMALGLPNGAGVLAVEWIKPGAGRFQGVVYSAIPVDEAIKLAQNGKNAGEILRVAYPTATLQLGPS